MAAKPLVYGAIDLGTTFSGWAYSSLAEPGKPITRTWYDHFSRHATEKIPTCLLIGQDGKTLDSFGYDAQKNYEELTREGTHEKYYYFVDFKTNLYGKYNQALSTGMKIIDKSGKTLPAIDVFTASIKYLADDMFATLQKRINGINKEDIHWTLTVPAIWTDQGKYMMRLSALKAGIKSKCLSIALEPEVASVYCRQLGVKAVNTKSSVSLATLQVGSTYLVVDAGGGTVDLAVHEIDSANCIKQVEASRGGLFGGNLVNREFETFLKEACSIEKYEKFEQNNKEDWLRLMADFELKKRLWNPRETSVRLCVPLSLKDTYKTTYIQMKERRSFRQRIFSRQRPEEHDNIMETALRGTRYGNDVRIDKDKMIFSGEMFSNFFREAIDGIKNHVQKLVGKLTPRRLSCILMVGGFSECTLLQERLMSAFPDIPFIVPEESSTAVLKGAVMYGQNPYIISERTMKYTYGVDAVAEFKTEHPYEKAFFRGDKLMCMDIFDKHVTKGQRVKTNEPQKTRTYYPISRRQRCMLLNIYATKNADPKYTTDKGCHLLGSLDIELPESTDSRLNPVNVSFAFGGAEIVVTAVEEKTGKVVKTNVHFLE